MTDQENTLRLAIEEINRLRRRNEVLEAKVSTMELFSVVLHTRPHYPEQGATIDPVWLLQKELDKLTVKP